MSFPNQPGRWFLVLSLLVGLLLTSPLPAASPSLSSIMPRGFQRGQDHVLTFRGARLSDSQEVFFYDEGLEVKQLEVKDDRQVQATVQIAPDCRLGEHVAQIRTATGISEFRTFFVGNLPTLAEKEPNNDFEQPQPIEQMNVTVTGVVQQEDVDHFVVDLKKGQRLAVEVEGLRLDTTLFDPFLSILNRERFELAVSDDAPLLGLDPTASIVAPEDGKYVILLRDTSYAGNGSSYYRMHVGTFPRPTAVYPAGGKLGEEIEVQFLGDAVGSFTGKFSLPTVTTESFGLLPSDSGGPAPSTNPFRLFEHGNVMEQEPNDAREQATPAELPRALNGIIEKTGDIDYFAFQAKKGQQFEVDCYARRIRSGLDPVMYVYDAKGKRLASDDDSRRPDSYFRFKVPADGQYTIRVNDHLSRGAAEFIYRIEFTPVQARLTLGIPRVSRYSQYRQQIFVPRGNRFATLVSASRRNFSGEIVLDDSNLPEGMKMIADPLPSNLSSMPVVFEAAADAPIEGALVDFKGRHIDESKNIVGGYSNQAIYVRGRPGQSIYASADVKKLGFAVVDEVPFHLEIVEPKVPIVRNGSMQLKMVAHRQDGFTKPITVEFPFRPPGIGASRRVTIGEGKNEVLYPLSANSKAEIKAWKVYAIGSADVGGTAWVSSQLATLEVAEPHVTVTMQRSSCDQGQEAQIFCKFSQRKPFAGEAKAQLLGLPANTQVEELEFTKDTKELVFQVKTTDKSRAGRHKNLFCQVTILDQGEPIVSRAGGVELQINKPLPTSEKTAKAPTVAKAQAKTPAKRPLSRLEKLRMAAKERAVQRAEETQATDSGGGG